MATGAQDAGRGEMGRDAARPYHRIAVMVTLLPDRAEKIVVDAASTAEAIRAVLQRDMVRAALERRPMTGLVISAFVDGEATGRRQRA